MGKLLVAIALLVANAAVQAEVNLSWEPTEQTVVAGQDFYVDLWATGGEVDEPFVLLVGIMDWPAELVELTGFDAGISSYDWLDKLTGFLPDGHADGLNDTFADGNGYFSAAGNFDELPVASTEGLLISRFYFTANAPGVATLQLLPEYGQYSRTSVYDDVVPGWNIVGDLGSATFEISSTECVGDLDGDGDTDQVDVGILLADWGCTSGDCPGDVDDDGDTDYFDLGVLLADWGCTSDCVGDIDEGKHR